MVTEWRVAASGKTAIEIAKQNPPDLILMDVKLQGGLNGIETAIIIKSESDGFIPVVFFTGLHLQEFPDLNLLEHCTYLNKPFTEEELIGCIETALRTKPDGLVLGEPKA